MLNRLLKFSVCVCVALTAIALCRADVPSTHPKPSPVKVIFDTDMQNDCDDAGALATLHKLADLDEAEILACVVDSRGTEKAMAATVSAINTYYGRPTIPIGTYQAKIKGLGKRSSYVAKIRDEFPHHALPDDEEPTALSVYRTALAAAPDSSVSIISVGFLPNLSDLLKSVPDAISPLSGADLVRAKVKRLVVMGGEFPKGADACNLVGDSAATQYVVAHWPTPILFSGAEIGNKIMTGKVLAATPASNPVRRAYELHGNLRGGRQSWDLTAVLAAVRDPHLYWDVSASGTINVARDGKDEWVPTPDQGHTYLIEKLPPEDVAKVLNDLISAPPALAKELNKPTSVPVAASPK